MTDLPPPPPYSENTSFSSEAWELTTTSPSSPISKSKIHSAGQSLPVAAAGSISSNSSSLPQRSSSPPPNGIEKLGRRLKDKVTHTTHASREAARAQRRAAEAAAYERYQLYFEAENRAAATGEPQFIGQGKDGKDVYIEPPYGGNYARNPVATYVRPSTAYPYGGNYSYGGGYGGCGYGYGGYGLGGYGYGAGLGLPLGLGLGAALLGGSLLF